MAEMEYPNSKRELGGSTLFIAIHEGVKSLYVRNESAVYDGFDGRVIESDGYKTKICPLNHANADTIRKRFPFTAPISHRKRGITIGLGDRLGLASPGHIRLLRDKDVFPVLAQQSVRELNLTGRTFSDVLDSATWAVFQEGYEKGFGADGDHLKSAAEVETALGSGFTMVTLDCSEHIRNDVIAMNERDAARVYSELPARERAALERAYLNRTFALGDKTAISFSPQEFQKIVLAYSGALRHSATIYHDVIRKSGREIDFEVSIDETLSTTSPQAHYFVANELQKAGVEAVSAAPRFCGEFQKGIDYKGDVPEFEKEFIVHTKIARQFGYKLSIHSGSDKFAVFPIIGRESAGRFHLKTAGTNWLEALRVIAEKNPELFRRLFAFAVDNLAEAKKYYHITENVSNIPPLAALSDDELPLLLNQNDARQVLHVTYGHMLLAQNGSMFGNEIIGFLQRNEKSYYDALEKHIGRHLDTLGIT